MQIWYELHDDTKWLPFVRDDIYPHKWDDEGEEDIRKFKKWQKLVENQKQGQPVGNLDIDESNPEWTKMDLDVIDYRMKGEYLQAFQPFYGPKEKSPPFSKTEILMKQDIMLDEIIAAIK